MPLFLQHKLVFFIREAKVIGFIVPLVCLFVFKIKIEVCVGAVACEIGFRIAAAPD